MSITSLSQNLFWRYFVSVGLLAIACMGSAYLTLSLLGLGIEASPVWPPAGIALAALLLKGRRLWTGIAIGMFWFNLSLGASWDISLGSVAGSTLQAVIGVTLLRRIEFRPSLERLKDALGLVILGAMIATLVNATISTTVSCWVGYLDWSLFGQNWGTMWLGDSTGILVVTPLLLKVGMGIPRRRLPRILPSQQIFEALLCWIMLWGVSWMVFVCQTSLALSEYPLEYLPFPFVVWATWRFRVWGAVFASLIVSGMAIGGALQGSGPFVVKVEDTTQAILLLQTFMAVLTTTALVLAATMSERQQAEEQLRATLQRDRLLAEIALRIRQSLDLDQIFQTTVTEVRQLLQADRVYIGHLDPTGKSKIVAESVESCCKSLLGWVASDELVQETRSLFSNRYIVVRDNTSRVAVTPHLQDYYDHYQIKATLTVPLILDNQLFGLLGVHQCDSPRHWQSFEVDLLRQLATQVTIAIQQAQLYQQVQTLNTNLEAQVEERTLQLQEKMQELQKLYELKDIFLQAVSHDLRTSIMGLLLILKNTQKCSGESISIPRPILERLIQTSDRQLTLINALSEDHFSEGRQIALHCQPLSLNELVGGILADLQPLFARNDAAVKILIPKHLPAIDADPAQLRCVFEHLFTNALKHNLPGVNITLEATVDKNAIHCTIADDGVGMTREQCDRLFKLYVRGLHCQHLTGIGLGLYLCRQIITAHGGQINANSSPGVGSTFAFTLPIAV
ncbi:MASE1 domain-containing protein [Coleofasciculus sp. LEGE 07081]|uniref:sensor histidine kinase n=1 Tax=Coleofasciculus sp. LEGE 07081 TaxID=2777967 RepID=UPI001D133411|nr:MASE1 domain-containing protein [Coleofasciculus sp. LEGE 07081]